MFKGILLALVLLCFYGVPSSAATIELKVMSFNVRWDGLDQGTNAWQNRKPLAVEVIQSHSPDVVGLQEPSSTQTQDLEDGLEGFTSFQAENDRDETITFLYKSDRFEMLDGGSFWLIENSELSGGTRRCVWIRLLEKTSGHGFFVFNNHFDHRSPESRFRSAQRLMEGIDRLAGNLPFIVVGDLNETETGPAIRYLLGGNGQLVDSHRIIHPESDLVGTGHGFTGEKDGKRIDYIFVREGDGIIDSKIIYDHRNGHYPSDHFPVMATVKLAL